MRRNGSSLSLLSSTLQHKLAIAFLLIFVLPAAIAGYLALRDRLFPAMSFDRTSSVVLIALTFVISSLGLAIMMSIVKAVSQLSSSANAIAEGDLSHSLAGHGTGQDEVSELSSSIDKIVQKFKEKARELGETQTQLIQAEKLQVVGSLAGGVAHEVKNPLAIIRQCADYLEKRVGAVDENLDLTLRNLKDAVKRADNIIIGLLDFSSISALHTSPESLNSVLEKSLRLVEHEANDHHVAVTKHFTEDMPKVEIDRNRVEQVLINLLLNAIHAMPNGGLLNVRSYAGELSSSGTRVRRHTGNSSSNGKAAVVVEIEDTGEGIPKDISDRIFDPFFTTRRETGGTGLGLSVVKTIMELHDARIDICNKNGDRGARATMVFKAREKQKAQRTGKIPSETTP